MLLDVRTKNKIVSFMPSSDAIAKLGNLFDVFSDATRLKIISMLLVSTMCVSDISEISGINQTTISHQLKTLKQAGIVTCKRQGKTIFYSVSSNKIGELLLAGVEQLGY